MSLFSSSSDEEESNEMISIAADVRKALRICVADTTKFTVLDSSPCNN